MTAVPHDIDWVKDRVRWYWEHKIVKPRKTMDRPAVVTEPEKKETSGTGADSTTAKDVDVAT